MYRTEGIKLLNILNLSGIWGIELNVGESMSVRKRPP